MNQIQATVIEIQSVDNITVVAFESCAQELRMMALGLNLPIKIGSKVTLGAKASTVSLAKNLSGMLSLSNQLICTVESINKGTLLCSVKVRFNEVLLESVITLASALKMNLQVGETITMLIKASELSIIKVDD
jgi:molybdopterin-binding protein